MVTLIKDGGIKFTDNPNLVKLLLSMGWVIKEEIVNDKNSKPKRKQ